MTQQSFRFCTYKPFQLKFSSLYIYSYYSWRQSKDRCCRDRETKRGLISRGRQQVAKLCILGHPPLVPLHLPFSSCPFSLKHSDCHLTPPRVIFLERRKPPFSLLLIWLQPKPTVAFPMWASPLYSGLSLSRFMQRWVFQRTLRSRIECVGWYTECVWGNWKVFSFEGKPFF